MSTVEDVVRMLDSVLGARTPEQLAQEQEASNKARLASLGAFMPQMGMGTETGPCPTEGCTGYRISNYETDENGNKINQGPFICTVCGSMG